MRRRFKLDAVFPDLNGDLLESLPERFLGAVGSTDGTGYRPVLGPYSSVSVHRVKMALSFESRFCFGVIFFQIRLNKGSSEVLRGLHRRWYFRFIYFHLNRQPEEPEAALLDAVSQFRRLGIQFWIGFRTKDPDPIVKS